MEEVAGVISRGLAVAELRRLHERTNSFRGVGMGGGTKDDHGLLSLVSRRGEADVSLAFSTLSKRATPAKHIESNRTSKRLKGRENSKDTLCRNVTIYGHCQYEDQGCAFNHDPNKPLPAQQGSSKKAYDLPPRLSPLPADLENDIPKAVKRPGYRGANESPIKKRKMTPNMFTERPDETNEMSDSSSSSSRRLQRIQAQHSLDAARKLIPKGHEDSTMSRENLPQSISQQRSPSLTTQFQQQHFGRQSGQTLPVFSLPSPHTTSHSNKLPELRPWEGERAHSGEWQSSSAKVEVPSERRKGICVSYTISEDMSGDRENKILSRISEKNRDSCEVKLRVRGSYGDRWSLKHRQEAMGDGNGARDQFDISGFKYVNPQKYPEISEEAPRNLHSAGELPALLSKKEKLKPRKGAGHLFDQRDCANCHTRVTHLWRRGPSGRKNLCDSCGTRLAMMQSSSQVLEGLEDPSDFLRRTMGPTVAVSPSISIPPPATLNNLRLSTSSFNMLTPSTPTSDSLTTATTLTSDMSRQSSLSNESILQSMEMMNCNSQASFSTDINDQFMHTQITPQFSSSRHSRHPYNEEQLKLLAGAGKYLPSHSYQIPHSSFGKKMVFPELKREPRNRERLRALEERQKISRRPGITASGKRSRDQDDGVRRQKPRIEHRTGLKSLISDVVVKREIVEID